MHLASSKPAAAARQPLPQAKNGLAAGSDQSSKDFSPSSRISEQDSDYAQEPPESKAH